jgi:S1-C subfamily serine protease
MAGEVVGITTAHLVGGENLNFAVPINDVKPMLLARPSKVQALPYGAKPVTAGPATGDSLSRTLAWMHATINKGDLENSSGFGEAKVTRLSYSSCNVHVMRSEKTKINGEVISRIDWFFYGR